ncbi:IQ and AAA domain-containing protein 1 [Biomphalaria glabrata]|nr:IQ and AAA domain-containing protein 1 [Biomphalaria glabrata]
MAPKKSKKKGKKKKKSSVKSSDGFFWNINPPIPINAYSNRKWHEVQLDINRMILEENALFFNKKGKPKEPKPIKNRDKAFQFCVIKYLKYILIARRLEECYTYMIHPQKRLLVKTCLSGIFTRILELKDLMIGLDDREFQFFDDVLQDLNLTPEDVVLPIPKYFHDDRYDVYKNREHILLTILQKLETNERTDRHSAVTMNREQAVLLIQRHQRAYMGRIRFYQTACKLSQMRNNYELIRKAADRWACYVYKIKSKRLREEEQQFLGMLSKPTDSMQAILKDQEEHIARNKKKVEDNINSYEYDKIMLEDDILTREGPSMAENLKYNIIQWLLEIKNLVGVFPDLPDEEMGGSSFLFSSKTVRQVEEDIREMFDDNKSKKPAKKESKKKEKKQKETKKPKKGEEEEFEWTIPQSQVMPLLTEEKEEYMKYWFYKDDSKNIHQKHDAQILKEAIRLKIAEQIRLEVDKLMRFELENMKIAIEKAPLVKKKSKKKDKKKKGGKKKKGKKEKDLTKDRTMEDLYQELVLNEIIKKPDPIHLSEFLGAFCYSGTNTQESNLNPLPSLADVRRLVTEFAILPLGSEDIHQLAPLNRSLLLAGVRGTGKKMLVNIICHEAGANLFDLTPTNLMGKYDSKAGMKMLMHLIMKVGKALEPSVFWIDQCEKMFLKKKDKTDPAKPTKWVKILNKTIKKIKNGDRMLLIGTTKRPNLAKQKSLAKFFKKTIIVPLPDYGSRYQIWQHFIGELAGLSHYEVDNMDFSSLTKVTTGFTVNAIKETCQDVLTKERVDAMRNKRSVLKPIEFVYKIACFEPIYREEHEDFLDWYNKTPLAKKRLDRLMPSGDQGKENKGKAKEKGKKKK